MGRKRVFLSFPEYPGGKEEFRKYITANLRYPAEALSHKIEGIVYLSALIDDNGYARDVTVEKGIGFGCNEEAVRLISEIRFGSVHNRGLRVKTKKKFRIKFKLPGKPKQTALKVQTEINYSYTKNKDTAANDKNTKVYSYTLQLPSADSGGQ
jgi:outer membrane biosynthesis protein TonB